MIREDITAKDVIAIVRRRLALILVFAVVGGTTGYVLSRVLPKRYTSRTLVLVQQPEMTSVASPIADNSNQRLAAMQQQILSRSRLEPVIRDLNLFQSDVDRVTVEGLIDRLRGAFNL